MHQKLSPLETLEEQFKRYRWHFVAEDMEAILAAKGAR